MADVNQDRDDVALLTTALDHAWRWYELRLGYVIQVVNFFLLAAAVMSAAYVSALNGRHYGVAGAIALVAGAVSSVAYLVSTLQADMAWLGLAPIDDIEDRLAGALDIDSLRLVKRHQDTRRLPANRARATAVRIIFPSIASALSVAAAVYAWRGH